MRKCSSSIALALLLGACGSGTPAPAPTEARERPDDPLPVMGPERHVVAFGDSLFAGYNVGEGESYPARLEVALRARGINARVVNAGVSGDTSAAGLQRLAFTLDNQPGVPDLVILELGGNDLLRGLSPSETRANLGAALAELKKRNIQVLLMGMRAPPNMGAAFQKEFDAIYPALAKQHGVALVPFLLEAVYDKPDLIQDDRVHPTAGGIEEMVASTADDVVKALPEKS